jgi:PadR family transcriptional regulator PadR
LRKGGGPDVCGRMERFMEPCLILLLLESPAHGYELLERLGQFGFKGGSADAASMYRALRRLEEEGVLVSQWEESDAGPPRRSYRVTEEGCRLLGRWRETIKANKRRLERFLKKCDGILEGGATECTP